MRIYKVLRAEEWRSLRTTGESAGAPVDVTDGFVHLSTAGQLAETLRRHFSGETELWLLALDTDHLGPALRWEPSRGGALFPHLYAPLRLPDIRLARPLERDAGGRLLLPEADAP